MEDYLSSFVQRSLDTKQLYKNGRKIAAMHMGGIAIECLLKALLVKYHGISRWDERSKLTGRKVYNPKHRLDMSVRNIQKLNARLHANLSLIKMMKEVQQPCGTDFIALRYSGKVPDQESFDRWYQSYISLLQWIIRQSKSL
jgi:hypothetical protein